MIEAREVYCKENAYLPSRLSCTLLLSGSVVVLPSCEMLQVANCMSVIAVTMAFSCQEEGKMSLL